MKRSTKTGATTGLLAILLGLSSFLGGLNKAKEESCELKVDNAHISHYTLNKSGVHKMKIDAMTKCNKPQKFSILGMEVIKVEGTRRTTAHVFDERNYLADKKEPNKAYALNFEIKCSGAHPLKYFGIVKGTIHMASGKEIPVEGKSNSIVYVDCVI